ncbi:hypothetical protein [Pedobacter sp. R-06]|uniref:hypothetical protein n=1 Tax=Pedobacter sp. R-06 TaxID=3404051 RepID=UPI003CF0B3AA
MITTQLLPEAFYDSLSLAHKLDNYLDGFKRHEIQLFSYFASILYLYSGKPIATWEYRYIVVDGFPFADTINEAITRHLANGNFEENDDFLTLSGRGTDEFQKFTKLSMFSPRERFLDAACTASILVPYSKTVKSLLSQPEIKEIGQLNKRSWLEQMNIYPKFQEISESLGVHTDDLLLPAVTWINYLGVNEKEEF